MTTRASYLLDTTVLVDVSREREPTASWTRALLRGPNIVGVSAVNVAELFAGLRPSERDRWASFVAELRYWEITPTVAIRAGIFRHDYARRGRIILIPDALIAATAEAVGGHPRHRKRQALPDARVDPPAPARIAGRTAGAGSDRPRSCFGASSSQRRSRKRWGADAQRSRSTRWLGRSRAPTLPIGRHESPPPCGCMTWVTTRRRAPRSISSPVGSWGERPARYALPTFPDGRSGRTVLGPRPLRREAKVGVGSVCSTVRAKIEPRPPNNARHRDRR